MKSIQHKFSSINHGAMYYSNIIKVTYVDQNKKKTKKTKKNKEKDREYEIPDLHEIDLIESTKTMMLQ